MVIYIPMNTGAKKKLLLHFLKNSSVRYVYNKYFERKIDQITKN